jgi:hypothetical protein
MIQASFRLVAPKEKRQESLLGTKTPTGKKKA